NGVAERFNRTLQERLITSLHAAGVNPSLWAKAAATYFLGHEAGTKGYRIWDIKERKVRISASVEFNERSFPICLRNPHIPQAAYDALAPPPLPTILPLALPDTREQGESAG
ncbi:hypothetical protein JCM11641_007761, partial [Rhodosporidiobolus odoratus]